MTTAYHSLRFTLITIKILSFLSLAAFPSYAMDDTVAQNREVFKFMKKIVRKYDFPHELESEGICKEYYFILAVSQALNINNNTLEEAIAQYYNERVSIHDADILIEALKAFEDRRSEKLIRLLEPWTEANDPYATTKPSAKNKNKDSDKKTLQSALAKPPQSHAHDLKQSPKQSNQAAFQETFRDVLVDAYKEIKPSLDSSAAELSYIHYKKDDNQQFSIKKKKKKTKKKCLPFL